MGGSGVDGAGGGGRGDGGRGVCDQIEAVTVGEFLE